MVTRHFSRLSLLIVVPFATSTFMHFSSTARADYIGYYPNGEEAREIDFGAGEDGSFNDGPAQTGISITPGVTTVISINTDIKSEFRFSSFNLSANHEVRATGSRPLILRIAGDAQVAATASVRADGDDRTTTPATTAGSPGPAGAMGGLGSVLTPAPAPATGGARSHTASTGGSAADRNIGGDTPAGGGGCFGAGGPGSQLTAGPGDAGSIGGGGAGGSCTTSRTTIASGFELDFRGGAGGAGGDTLLGISHNGGGGGGSGGALRVLVQGNLVVDGSIQAAGGVGGNGAYTNPEGDCSAAGGGGSGGALWIQVGGSLTGALSGTLSAAGGAGGTSPCGYTGGAGSRGVLRVDGDASAFGGNPTFPGGADVEYSIAQYPVVTNFKLEGGGLLCGTLREVSGSPRNRRGNRAQALLELIGIFSLAYVATRRSQRETLSAQRSPISH